MGPRDNLYLTVRCLAYSGMRVEELCGITGRDIMEVGGIMVFAIRESKSAAGLRRVPVHTELLPVVEGLGPDQRLIPGTKPSGPDAKRSKGLSTRFSQQRRRWCLPAGVVLHSLRNTVIAKLEAASVPETTTELIVGHSRRGLAYGRYSRELPIHVLRDAIQKVRYNGL